MKMTRGDFNLAHQIFERATDGLEEYLKDTFSEVKDYGAGFGRTIRQNGEVVSGGTRNIYDTGELANSVIREDSNGKVVLKVTADHAAAVLYGHRTGETFVPGRNYLSPTIEEFKKRVDE